MARSVILGNGRLTVGLNEKGMVHDFYYPYVGQENLTTARSMHHRIGVFVDGVFSWIDNDDWSCQVDLSESGLIATCIFRNDRLQLTISSTDFVDYEYDAFCRKIKIDNRSDNHREIRLFMHQVFEISNAGRADTAMFVPDKNYILDYKGRCSLLINGTLSDNSTGFDQFAVGNYGIEGKNGTYMDAEDGELSDNPVEHGGVDSTIRFTVQCEPHEDRSVNYWVAAAESQYQCEKIDEIVKTSLVDRLNNNLMYWQSWFSQMKPLPTNMPKEQVEFLKKSLLTIKAHCDARGGIIASCDSSIYNYGRDYYSYVWPRDGALAIWPLIRLGFYDEAKNFFIFARDIITPEGFLMHKFQPDRSVGSTWHPLVHKTASGGRQQELAIQEDETAVIIFMLAEYLRYSNDVEFIRSMFDSFVVPAADFISSFIDEQTGLPHASYDLWEEKFSTSTYTTSVSFGALISACDLAEALAVNDHIEFWSKAAQRFKENYGIFVNPDSGVLRKGFLLDGESNNLHFDETLDTSSFWGMMIFNIIPNDNPIALKTTVESMISTVGEERIYDTGLPRYIGDYYFRATNEPYGNPWIVTTMWLAQYFIRANDQYRAKKLLSVAERAALSSGVMPEQINAETKAPVSVTPLVWSHAEYINTALDYYSKFEK